MASNSLTNLSMRFITIIVRNFFRSIRIVSSNETENDVMSRAKSFFPAGLKFNYENKSILNVSLDAGCATSPAGQHYRTRQIYGLDDSILFCFFFTFFCRRKYCHLRFGCYKSFNLVCGGLWPDYIKDLVAFQKAKPWFCHHFTKEGNVRKKHLLSEYLRR